MIQLQIEVKYKNVDQDGVLSIATNVLSREDANEMELQIIKAIEEKVQQHISRAHKKTKGMYQIERKEIK
jgi:hypothetical protein